MKDRENFRQALLIFNRSIRSFNKENNKDIEFTEYIFDKYNKCIANISEYVDYSEYSEEDANRLRLIENMVIAVNSIVIMIDSDQSTIKEVVKLYKKYVSFGKKLNWNIEEFNNMFLFFLGAEMSLLPDQHIVDKVATDYN